MTADTATKSVSRQVRQFTQDNLSELKAIFIHFFPYLMGGYIISAFVHIALLQYDILVLPPKLSFILIDIVWSYFTASMVIEWMRYYYFGSSGHKLTNNPIMPTKKEMNFYLIYIFMNVLHAYTIYLIFMDIFSLYDNNPALYWMLVLSWVVFSTWLTLRFSFIFPQLVIHDTVNVRRAFRLSRGYAGRLFWHGVLACIYLIVGAFLYAILAGGVLNAVFGDFTLGIVDDPKSLLASLLGQLPSYLFFGPMIGILVITVDTKYYQIAQDKLENENPIQTEK